MSDTVESLRRQISSASDLQSVVRSMKALAASSIGQYEQSVLALADYYRTVELGLGACFRASASAPHLIEPKRPAKILRAVVFGSDQGLVGQFNDVVADFAIKTLAARPENSESLGRRRARSCASCRCRIAARRSFRRAEFGARHHAARRANFGGE